MAETVVRLYDDISDAYRVVDQLVRAGYNRDDITLMAYDPEGAYADYVDVNYQEVQDVGEEAAVGAGVGALIGGLGGLLVGLGALTIPGLGPIIAAGPIAAALIGAGTGATVGGLVGALVETGVPAETAGHYAEGVRRGGTLVVMRTREDLLPQAQEIMDQYGAVNMEERTASWRARGWQGYNPEEEPYTVDQMEDEADYYDNYDPAFRRHFQTRYSASGYPYARLEPAYRYGYDLAYDDRYMDRDWDEFEPAARREWERDHPDSLWDDVKDAVRNAWDEVQNAFDTDEEQDFQGYNDTFRTHYTTTYQTSGRDYDYYQPAYRYGYNLAYDDRYMDRDWNEFEPEARREWERDHPESLWDDVKDAVRNAWNEVQNAFDFDDEEDYQSYNDTFRTHYTTTYHTRGRDYDYYEPAYRYGYNLAYDDRYADRDWNEIEPEARRQWERDHPDSLWDDVKDAIENAWNEVQNTFDFEEDYQSYNPSFRTHYNDTYGTSGRNYDYYEPAYRYGHSLAYDERYIDRDWNEFESNARSEWETEYGQGTWENFKDAVRNAWNEVRNAFDLEDKDEPNVNIDYDYQEYDDYDRYQDRFLNHYTTTYGTTGYNYDYYEPAYRYGYDLATSERYGHRDWGEIETEARDLWEGRNEGTWDRFKNAVEHAWHEVKEGLGLAKEERTTRTTTDPRQYS